MSRNRAMGLRLLAGAFALLVAMVAMLPTMMDLREQLAVVTLIPLTRDPLATVGAPGVVTSPPLVMTAAPQVVPRTGATVAGGKPTCLGTWTGTAGGLRVTVTGVEVIQSTPVSKQLRLYVTVENTSASTVILPVSGHVTAVDDLGQVHPPSASVIWNENFPARALVSGSIDLADAISPNARSLTLNFPTISTADAALNGQTITIPGVCIP